MKIAALIVNRNNLAYVKDLVSDLDNQSFKDFDLFIVDNGSIEENTKNELLTLKSKYSFIKEIEFTNNNTPLSHLWNSLYDKKEYDLLSYLNNDMRISYNFMSTVVKVFNIDPTVGCVGHTTNHPSYDRISDELNYVKSSDGVMQGWDFTIKRVAYTKIPNSIHFFCGDDFIFENLYKKGFEFALVTNSPVLHYQAQTPRTRGMSPRDIAEYKKLGYPHPRLRIWNEYCNHKPTFNKIIQNGEH